MARKHELRHADLIARMSNEEKAAMLSGSQRVGDLAP